MSVRSTKIKSPRSHTDWKRLRKLEDREIDFSDIPETDEKFWENAAVIIPTAKIHLSMRLDENVVDWFKRQGPGYETRMNAVLRSYVQAVSKGRRSHKHPNSRSISDVSLQGLAPKLFGLITRASEPFSIGHWAIFEYCP
jgi:uncharacterized protein (DUF4415 family)